MLRAQVISTAFSDDDLLYAAGCTNKDAIVVERTSGKEVASFQATRLVTASLPIHPARANPTLFPAPPSSQSPF